jgi:hypothetical protein
MKVTEPIAVAMIAVVGGIAGAAIGPIAEAPEHSQEIHVKMIELAVDILKSTCTSDAGLVPAREWAVNLIDRYSPIPLSDQAKAAIVHNSIAPGAFDSGFSSDFDIGRNPCEGAASPAK